MRSTVLDMHLLTLARALTEVPPTSPGRQSRLRRLFREFFRVDDSDVTAGHERIQQDRSQHLCLTCVHAVASLHRAAACIRMYGGDFVFDIKAGCFRLMCLVAAGRVVRTCSTLFIHPARRRHRRRRRRVERA